MEPKGKNRKELEAERLRQLYERLTEAERESLRRQFERRHWPEEAESDAA